MVISTLVNKQHPNHTTTSIGCFSAFYGDSPHALSQFISHPEADSRCPQYLIGDYLSEVTMAILARIQAKVAASASSSAASHQNGNYISKAGYIREFADLLKRDLWNKWPRPLKAIIVNAGGLNPRGLKELLELTQKQLLQQKGASSGGVQWKVAAVYGDDLRENLHTEHWERFSIVDEKHDLPSSLQAGSKSNADSSRTTLLSANVYLGARGVTEALRNGANIVVTGRCVDSALVLGPLVKEFNWDWDKDYDALASASLVGHIIECGCQCTGGNFTDWKDSLGAHHTGWTNVGFPVAEFNGDTLGAVITKLPETGGVVNEASVAEQILYEIQDPSCYILPDVVVDLTKVKLQQLGKDRVSVWGARGKAPPPKLKICLTYSSKFKTEANLMIGGLDAASKAREVGRAIVEKCNTLLQKTYQMSPFSDTCIEVLGSEHTYGPHSRVAALSREVILRIVVVHQNPKALRLFAREIAPSATGMAPGITGAGSGRPREQPLIEFAAYLIDRKHTPKTMVDLPNGSTREVSNYCDQYCTQNDCKCSCDDTYQGGPPSLHTQQQRNTSFCTDEDSSSRRTDNDWCLVPLHSVCHARSGDKGSTCNVGVRCRDARLFPILTKQLTAQRVHDALHHLEPSKVNRYSLPSIASWNFLIGGAILGGGGLSSLRTDRQGKAVAQQLLSILQVRVPRQILRDIKRRRSQTQQEENFQRANL